MSRFAHIPNTLTAKTLQKSERGEDVHHSANSSGLSGRDWVHAARVSGMVTTDSFLRTAGLNSAKWRGAICYRQVNMHAVT